MKKVICLLVVLILINAAAVQANAETGSTYAYDPIPDSETGRTTDGFDMTVYNNTAYFINHSVKAKGYVYSIKIGPEGKIDIAKAKPIGSDSYCSNLNLLKGCLYYASMNGIQKYDILHKKFTYLYKSKGVNEAVATQDGIIFTKLANDSKLYGLWSVDTAGKKVKQLSTTGDIKNLQYYNKCIYYIYKPHTLGQLRSFNLKTRKEESVISGAEKIGDYRIDNILDYHIYSNVVYISGWLKTKDNHLNLMVYSVDLADTGNRKVTDFMGQLFMIGNKEYIYTLGSSDGYTSWADIYALDIKTASLKRIFEDSGVSSRLGFTCQTSSGKKLAYVFEYKNANLDELINIRKIDLEALE